MPETLDPIAHLDFQAPCITCLDLARDERATTQAIFHLGCAFVPLCDGCSHRLENRVAALASMGGCMSCPKCGVRLPADALVTLERMP